ncbi:hydantoinase/oxoprolinase family protein [Aquamicrobium sp. LC103]|uniref:hydantoinase/oxoprolinase family protein n=1 Tax=Aquamicrobium sp. LC103 TaxID=1120658 RepID=UPI00063E8CA1|nr:hydantoinase/oxoprolinase family protein [Aquamicrobium sp. LC103]
MENRLGIDIGGTFTDFVMIDSSTGDVTVEKCLTTPAAPEQAIFTGIEQIETRGGSPLRAEVVHATTLITNAILEHKGAQTGLITTRGFRDILEMGNETRYYVYDLFQSFPKPIVPRALRRGVAERTLTNGSIVESIDEEEVAQVVRELVAAGVDSIAVLFLHSYNNPTNERAARKIINKVAPQVSVSLSHEVVSRPREFERLSTTVVDAYVQPIAAGYMKKLAGRLRESGRSDSVSIMLSNGGIAPIETASKNPVQLVESGPAAGVEAAQYYGRLLGIDRVLAFDMGGTTAKLCLIREGKVSRTQDFEVGRVNRFRKGSGYRLAVSVYNLLEIGAGGGSIARINAMGLLAVGPDSAGSEPGPACYGRGGELPTVTDADLVLGFIDPASFLGGDFPLDPGAAERSILAALAETMSLSVPAAAWGIFDIVTETMASAARLHLSEQGDDPTRCTLIASGGAGPVHAVALARRMGCPHVVIPPLPGVMSAFGLLAARPAFERIRAVRFSLDDADAPEVERAFKRLEAETFAESGIRSGYIVERHVEICHRGQDSAVEVDGSGDWTIAATRARARADFADEYRRMFGRAGDGKPLQIAAMRVVVARANPDLRPPQTASDAASVAAGMRKVYFSPAMEIDTPVFLRHSLRAGASFHGPAIIEERESTTVIWPGDRVRVDASGAIIIDVGVATAEH